MTPLALSIVGVACSVLEQLITAGLQRLDACWRKLFCQTILPVSASTADSTSSMPMEKTRSLVPSGVATPPATTGAVRVDSTSAGALVVSCVFHSGLRRPTVFVRELGLAPIPAGALRS